MVNKQETITFLEEQIKDCQQHIDFAIEGALWNRKMQARFTLGMGFMYWLVCVLTISSAWWTGTIVNSSIGLFQVFFNWFLWRHAIRGRRESKRNWARLRDLFKKELEEIQNDF